jgi:hypothetical protein
MKDKRIEIKVDSSKKLGYLCATHDQECIHSSSGIRCAPLEPYKRKLQHARRSLQLRSSRGRGVDGCFADRSAPQTPNSRLIFLADTACQ